MSDLNRSSAPSTALDPEQGARVGAVIPCLDEAEAIGPVVRAVLAAGVAEVVVVDGGSADATAAVAGAAGARVVIERRRGYGRALMSGVEALGPERDVVLFLDGDGSDDPAMIPAVVGPVLAGRAALVHGSRARGPRERGSLSVPQLVAGHLAGLLIRRAYGARFTDMSPFRAIDRVALASLGMREASYGWNLEMLMRAAAAGLACEEVAVGQRRRAGGESKVSGNPRAVLRAAWSIASTFARLRRELGAR